jgi:hypothetical protein
MNHDGAEKVNDGDQNDQKCNQMKQLKRVK